MRTGVPWQAFDGIDGELLFRFDADDRVFCPDRLFGQEHAFDQGAASPP